MNPIAGQLQKWYTKMKYNNNETRKAGGLRRSPFYVLTESEIWYLRDEIRAIGADEGVFRFNKGWRTCYNDVLGYIYIRGDIMPDMYSIHPRDVMSPRAVLAHEYYGHYLFRPSDFSNGDWRDEMRASYIAAIEAPNLSDDDRRNLMLDAYERAREGGYVFKYSKKAREIIYGY